MAAAVPRPAKGFTPKRAEMWVLVSLTLTTLVYAVRHLIEGETSPAPATSSARAFLGQGAPPNFGQWFTAEATAYLFLALLAVTVPEIGASLAIFVMIATFVGSGGQLAADLKGLEAHNLPAAKPSPSTLGPSGSQTVYPLPAGQTVPATFGAPTSSSLFGGLAPSPQSVGRGVTTNSAKITALNAQILAEAKNLPKGYTVKISNGIAELVHNGVVVSRG